MATGDWRLEATGMIRNKITGEWVKSENIVFCANSDCPGPLSWNENSSFCRGVPLEKGANGMATVKLLPRVMATLDQPMIARLRRRGLVVQR